MNITARVMVGMKLAFNWGKLFKPEETVQTVVDKTVQKAAEREQRGLIFVSVEVYATEDAMADAGKSLDPEDLPIMTVGHLKEDKTRFLKLQAEYDGVGDCVLASLAGGMPGNRYMCSGSSILGTDAVAADLVPSGAERGGAERFFGRGVSSDRKNAVSREEHGELFRRILAGNADPGAAHQFWTAVFGELNMPPPPDAPPYPGVCKDERNRVGELQRLAKLLGLRAPEIEAAQDPDSPPHARTGRASVTLTRNSPAGVEEVLRHERSFQQEGGVSRKAMQTAVCNDVIARLIDNPPVPPVTRPAVEGYDWAEVGGVLRRFLRVIEFGPVPADWFYERAAFDYEGRGYELAIFACDEGVVCNAATESTILAAERSKAVRQVTWSEHGQHSYSHKFANQTDLQYRLSELPSKLEGALSYVLRRTTNDLDLPVVVKNARYPPEPALPRAEQPNIHTRTNWGDVVARRTMDTEQRNYCVMDGLATLIIDAYVSSQPSGVQSGQSGQSPSSQPPAPPPLPSQPPAPHPPPPSAPAPSNEEENPPPSDSPRRFTARAYDAAAKKARTKP